MNTKNNKGITLLSLVITVIVMAILATVAVSLGINMTGTAKFENIETSLLLIQSKTKIKAEKLAIGEIEEDELYGTKQTEGTYSGWYLLSQQDLGEMGLQDLNAEDGYYVDYENDDVAYAKGAVLDGMTFYKLSAILNYAGD